MLKYSQVQYDHPNYDAKDVFNAEWNYQKHNFLACPLHKFSEFRVR